MGFLFWQEFTTIAFSPEAWGRDEVGPRKEGSYQKTDPEVQFYGLSDSEVFLWYFKLRLHKKSTSALNHDSFPPSTPSWANPSNYNDPERGQSLFLFLLYGFCGESEKRKSRKRPSPERLPKSFIQDSLPPPSFSVLGKLISVLEKSGDHEPHRRP